MALNVKQQIKKQGFETSLRKQNGATDSIVYSWITKKFRHQLNLDLSTLDLVLSLQTSLCAVQTGRVNEKLHCKYYTD